MGPLASDAPKGYLLNQLQILFRKILICFRFPIK